MIPENAVAFNLIYGRPFSSNKPVIGEHEEDMQGQLSRGTDCQSDIFRTFHDLSWRNLFWQNSWSFWVIHSEINLNSIEIINYSSHKRYQQVCCFWPYTVWTTLLLTVNPSLPIFFILLNCPEYSRYLRSLLLNGCCCIWKHELHNKGRSCLPEQEEGVNISANAVHPGVITTNLFRNRTIVSGIFSSLAINFIYHMSSRMGKGF